MQARKRHHGTAVIAEIDLDCSKASASPCLVPAGGIDCQESDRPVPWFPAVRLLQWARPRWSAATDFVVNTVAMARFHIQNRFTGLLVARNQRDSDRRLLFREGTFRTYPGPSSRHAPLRMHSCFIVSIEPGGDQYQSERRAMAAVMSFHGIVCCEKITSSNSCLKEALFTSSRNFCSSRNDSRMVSSPTYLFAVKPNLRLFLSSFPSNGKCRQVNDSRKADRSPLLQRSRAFLAWMTSGLLSSRALRFEFLD